MKIAFVINSRSKLARERKTNIPSIFGSTNATILQTTHHGHAQLLAEEAVEQGFDIIVAAGGDGTINQCVNGMIDSGLECDQLPTLAVWPGGCGNDFARTHDCPTRIEDVRQAIEAHQTCELDVGRIDHSKSVRQYFVNIAEIGLGTTVIQRAEKLQRWVGDRIGYQMAILRTVAACPEFEGSVNGDDFSFRGRFSTIAVANAKYYGSGLGVAPSADISDGLLDVVLLRAFTPVDFVRYLGKLRRCEPIADSRIQTYQTTQLSIEGKATTSMDGEIGGRLPLKIDILPNRIRLLTCGK